MILMRGELVTLEPLDVAKHAEGYFEVCQDEKIHEFVGNTVPEAVDEVVELLKEYEKHFMNWMIISNETHSVIGIIRLGKPQKENGVLVAGESQRIASRYWRKGHMKEAKKLFYQYVFQELSVEILYADVWEGNVNSMRSLASSGYRLIKTEKDIFPKTGKYMKRYLYSLTRDVYHRKLRENAEAGII